MPNVTVKNNLAQLITASTDAGGGPVALKLSPKGESAGIDSTHITDYTKRLAQLGHVTIRWD